MVQLQDFLEVSATSYVGYGNHDCTIKSVSWHSWVLSHTYLKNGLHCNLTGNLKLI